MVQVASPRSELVKIRPDHFPRLIMYRQERSSRRKDYLTPHSFRDFLQVTGTRPRQPSRASYERRRGNDRARRRIRRVSFFSLPIDGTPNINYPDPTGRAAENNRRAIPRLRLAEAPSDNQIVERDTFY